MTRNIRLMKIDSRGAILLGISEMLHGIARVHIYVFLEHTRGTEMLLLWVASSIVSPGRAPFLEELSRDNSMLIAGKEASRKQWYIPIVNICFFRTSSIIGRTCTIRRTGEVRVYLQHSTFLEVLLEGRNLPIRFDNQTNSLQNVPTYFILSFYV